MSGIGKINVNTQPRKTEEQPVQNKKSEKNDKPSIGGLLGKAATVAMLPVSAAAGVIYLGGKSVEGLVTKKPYEQAMNEGLKDVSQGADMLDKMWNGKFF